MGDPLAGPIPKTRQQPAQSIADADAGVRLYVRFGSLANILRYESHRFTPESGHVRCSQGFLLWANSGH
jgi:hypothetical protein